MKVLHIIPSIASIRGGPSLAAIEMVQALRERGVEAEIATTNDNGSELLDVPLGKCIQYNHIPVRFFPRFSPPVNSLKEFCFSGEFTIWLWQCIHKYDLLHIHALFSYTSTVAMTIARLKKIPYIVQPHGLLCEWSLQQSAKKKRLYFNLLEQANLSYSQFLHFTTTQELKEFSNLNLKCNSFILPLGLEIPSVIQDAPQKLRKYLQLPADEPIILFLSRLHPKKGLDFLIPALSKISSQRFTFILAGGGTADYEEEVQSLLDKYGIRHRTYLPGFISGEQKNLFLQGSDIFALTSHSENFGISVLEAFAAAIPVIITPGVALADIVEQYELGYVSPLDINTIAVGIEELLKFPELSKKKGSCARKLMLEKYSWEKISINMCHKYNEILKIKADLAVPKT